MTVACRDRTTRSARFQCHSQNCCHALPLQACLRVAQTRPCPQRKTLFPFSGTGAPPRQEAACDSRCRPVLPVQLTAGLQGPPQGVARFAPVAGVPAACAAIHAKIPHVMGQPDGRPYFAATASLISLIVVTLPLGTDRIRRSPRAGRDGDGACSPSPRHPACDGNDLRESFRTIQTSHAMHQSITPLRIFVHRCMAALHCARRLQRKRLR